MNNALELASQGAIVIEVKCRAEIKIVLGHTNWNTMDLSQAWWINDNNLYYSFFFFIYVACEIDYSV